MTNETKHTPGPWARNEGDEIVGSNGDLVVSLVDRYCDTYSNEHDFEGNARLISAAPTMKQTLEAVLDHLDTGSGDLDEYQDQCSALRDRVEDTLEAAS